MPIDVELGPLQDISELLFVGKNDRIRDALVHRGPISRFDRAGGDLDGGIVGRITSLSLGPENLMAGDACLSHCTVLCCDCFRITAARRLGKPLAFLFEPRCLGLKL